MSPKCLFDHGVSIFPGSGSPSSEACLSVSVESPETSASSSATAPGFVGLQSQRSVGLAVVEERDEAMVGRMEDLEDNVERLNTIIKETEVCLLQVINQGVVKGGPKGFQAPRPIFGTTTIGFQQKHTIKV